MKAFVSNSVVWSLLVHLGLAVIFVVAVFSTRLGVQGDGPVAMPETEFVQVMDVEKAAPAEIKPVLASERVRAPEKQPEAKRAPVKEVFGIRNKDSQVGDEFVGVKRGNTLAKASDTEKFVNEDELELPIPKAEYLITKMPTLLKQVKVQYPEKAKKMGLAGTVVLSLLINQKGKVVEAKVLEGMIPEMDQQALIAVKQYLFSPAYIEQEAVAVRIRYDVVFVLENS
jgi:protein TonB